MQRLGSGNIDDQAGLNEEFFGSLGGAKAYVKGHFKSGAEYFSSNQSADPDNILHTIIDKITYMILRQHYVIVNRCFHWMLLCKFTIPSHTYG
ncbi:hypothetical protein [Dyadobacter sp. CY326]|uniref:hypothetical protein n=1 Tax=Dyadobacter sp. CY326 TaxID=2907300 RepID=UPI001F2B1856|nr:hypothetical protein [Dyadobacter sp. CY326]MCE7065195.1 hypothetical protein [Dyadobacter sp. CY326]